MPKLYSAFSLGDMELRYITDDEGHIGMLPVPAGMADAVCDKPRCAVEPLVQLHLAGEPYPGRFSQGRTMRGGEAVRALRLVSQRATGTRVVTELADGRGLRATHAVRLAGKALEVTTSLTNDTGAPVSLEMLSSFTLGGLTPFAPDDAPERLYVSRMLSTWSCEGRLLRQRAEELELEPSWSHYSANSIRFGQVGSMPVRGWVPMAGVTDAAAGVTWAAELTHPYSWQLELSRVDDGLTLSGGIADREFGHFVKTLAPGETFAAPEALITCVRGDFDMAGQRIASSVAPLYPEPAAEAGLPVIFNEFCTTWGKPGAQLIGDIIEKIKGRGLGYFVIDAGWFRRGDSWSGGLGDWQVSPQAFPDGMDAALGAIRDAGLVPGIWFEFEVTTKGAAIFERPEMQLQRDGAPVQSGERRFLDFTRADVRAYMREHVIEFLRAHGFGYMKVDYNESIGMGADGCESLGEKLRRQVCAVEDFFDEVRRELPQLTLEICSSGGHRMVPQLLSRCSMVSFSDAHECAEIPIVARNVQRFVKPAQSQIWAVLRREFDPARLYYRITGGMLGRLCLSGDVLGLSAEQWRVIDDGIAFYGKAAPVIADGVSEFFGTEQISTRHPRGWQAVVRRGGNGRVLAVLHTFERAPGEVALALPGMRIAALYARDGIAAELTGGALTVRGLADFDGCAALLEPEG